MSDLLMFIILSLSFTKLLLTTKDEKISLNYNGANRKLFIRF